MKAGSPILASIEGPKDMHAVARQGYAPALDKSIAGESGRRAVSQTERASKALGPAIFSRRATNFMLFKKHAAKPAGCCALPNLDRLT